MLVLNQRPLPCEASTMVCWRFRELSKYLQKKAFLSRRFPQHFRRFTRLAARLLLDLSNSSLIDGYLFLG